MGQCDSRRIEGLERSVRRLTVVVTALVALVCGAVLVGASQPATTTLRERPEVVSATQGGFFVVPTNTGTYTVIATDGGATPTAVRWR
ncbi:MAG: hypothetical protein KF768_00110 [Phycisphaeraceae bacterium]|nr:hypothetical protein [Phycisphaeraceae bacterium]